MSPTEHFGIGAIEQVRSILAQEKPDSIFFVHGKNSYRLSGAEEKLGRILQDYKVTPFLDFSSNAKVEDIEKGLDLFRRKNCHLVIAVGGGSALDLAKGIAILASNPGAAPDYVTKQKSLRPRIIPFLAIPTTAGTGSEATHFAAIYIGKTKYSLAHYSLVPDYAIVDPSLTFTLSPYQTACTGMDALAQAIESYWSIHSTEESKRYAREAITLALAHLEHAVTHPASQDRVGMAKAAHLAGKAINISFTTACHAISYSITSYFNVPHGHAVALTLPEMVAYNARVSEENCLDTREIRYVKSMLDEICRLFGVFSPEEVKNKLERLMDAIGLERKLTRLGIYSPEDLKLIIRNGFNPERMKNNPRKVEQDDLRKMLGSICIFPVT